MKIECGTMGLIGRDGLRVSVDNWVIDHDDRVARAYCDVETFRVAFDFETVNLVSLINTSWLVRLDNVAHIYHGSVKCEGVGLPNLQRPDPSIEYFPNSLVLYFRFLHTRYGPYHVQEGQAMARNGNDLFFDLLRADELKEKVESRDVRFSSTAKTV
jgi:hypothetical protein